MRKSTATPLAATTAQTQKLELPSAGGTGTGMGSGSGETGATMRPVRPISAMSDSMVRMETSMEEGGGGGTEGSLPTLERSSGGAGSAKGDWLKRDMGLF